ncbi:hypothetical protein [Clostridium ljungdahlii]|nr:hypothetical protein [Clostridium ljungdahlii]
MSKINAVRFGKYDSLNVRILLVTNTKNCTKAVGFSVKRFR